MTYYDIMNLAYKLRVEAKHYNHVLNEKTTLFILTYDALDVILNDPDSMRHMNFYSDKGNGKPKYTLMGLPVRISCDDDKGTPPVTLVMEPLKMERNK